MRSHSAGGDQAGDRVERDDPLDPLIAAVDGKRDPLLAHRQVGDLVAAFQLFGAQLDQPLVQRRIVRARALARIEHLVVSRQLIAAEQVGLVVPWFHMHRWLGLWCSLEPVGDGHPGWKMCMEVTGNRGDAGWSGWGERSPVSPLSDGE